MTTPVGRPPSQITPLGPDHPLGDPLGFPLVFKQWVVEYVTQELQLARVFGYDAPLTFIRGRIPPTGTTPTAGGGFTYTHTDTSGVYVFTFTTAFPVTPVVLAQPVSSTTDVNVVVSGLTASGFTARTFSAAGAAADLTFNFVALTE